METIKRIAIILLAALLLTALTLPLAQTEWADGMRSGDSGEGNMNGESRGDMSGVLLTVISFVKTLVVMGIPFGLTLLVLRLTQRPSKETS